MQELVNLIFFSGQLEYNIMLMCRYVKGSYENVSSTIGVEFAYKVATLKNKTKIKAQIWDTCTFIKFNSNACCLQRAQRNIDRSLQVITDLLQELFYATISLTMILSKVAPIGSQISGNSQMKTLLQLLLVSLTIISNAL